MTGGHNGHGPPEEKPPKDKPLQPPPNPGYGAGYLDANGNWHPLTGYYDDDGYWHPGEIPEKPENPYTRPPRLPEDMDGAHKGEWVKPNSSFVDLIGRKHNVYKDAMGIHWILSDHESYSGQRQCLKTVDDWNHQFQALLQPQDDQEDEEEQPQQVSAEALYQFRDYIQREKEKRRLRARIQNEMDSPFPKFESPPQVNRNPAEKRKAMLDLAEEVLKKHNIDESPISITQIPILAHRVQSKRHKPGDVFEKYVMIPGKKITYNGTPQGFPGTEGRIEKHTFNPVLNLGPGNTVSSYDEAVANGPLSVAAWTHDIAYDGAESEQDLINADTVFLGDLLMIPEAQRDALWYIAYEAINAGTGRIWNKIYNSI